VFQIAIIFKGSPIFTQFVIEVDILIEAVQEEKHPDFHRWNLEGTSGAKHPSLFLWAWNYWCGSGKNYL